MLEHFKDYNDIVGDHPQNLRATSLALNAYALTGEAKYKDWLLEYVDAWRERTTANGGIIPTNIGLDGKIGGAAGGKWYGGVYGWGFTVVVPQTGEHGPPQPHRPRAAPASRNAYLLTGDDSYLDVWRKQIDTINAQRRMRNGRYEYPRMYGDQGWYACTPQPYAENALELYCLSMREDDAKRVGDNRWLDFLAGKNAGLSRAGAAARLGRRSGGRVAGMRADATTPDTRLADDPMKFNPATAGPLLAARDGRHRSRPRRQHAHRPAALFRRRSPPARIAARCGRARHAADGGRSGRDARQRQPAHAPHADRARRRVRRAHDHVGGRRRSGNEGRRAAHRRQARARLREPS